MTQPQPDSGAHDAAPEGWAPAPPPDEPAAATPPPPHPDLPGTQQYPPPGYPPPPPVAGAPFAGGYPGSPPQYPANPYPAAAPYPVANGPYGASPYQPYAPPAPLSSAVPIVRWLMVGAAVLVMICAFLPWATAKVLGAEVSVHGTDSGKDGWFTLGMAVIAAIIAVISATNRKPGGIHLAAGIVGTVLGALITIVGLADLGDLNNRDDEIAGYGGHIDAGFGLIGTILFGVVLLAFGIAGIVKRR